MEMNEVLKEYMRLDNNIELISKKFNIDILLNTIYSGYLYNLDISTPKLPNVHKNIKIKAKEEVKYIL